MVKSKSKDKDKVKSISKLVKPVKLPLPKKEANIIIQKIVKIIKSPLKITKRKEKPIPKVTPKKVSIMKKRKKLPRRKLRPIFKMKKMKFILFRPKKVKFPIQKIKKEIEISKPVIKLPEKIKRKPIIKLPEKLKKVKRKPVIKLPEKIAGEIKPVKFERIFPEQISLTEPYRYKIVLNILGKLIPSQRRIEFKVVVFSTRPVIDLTDLDRLSALFARELPTRFIILEVTALLCYDSIMKRKIQSSELHWTG